MSEQDFEDVSRVCSALLRRYIRLQEIADSNDTILAQEAIVGSRQAYREAPELREFDDQELAELEQDILGGHVGPGSTTLEPLKVNLIWIFGDFEPTKQVRNREIDKRRQQAVQITWAAMMDAFAVVFGSDDSTVTLAELMAEGDRAFDDFCNKKNLTWPWRLLAFNMLDYE